MSSFSLVFFLFRKFQVLSIFFSQIGIANGCTHHYHKYISLIGYSYLFFFLSRQVTFK